MPKIAAYKNGQKNMISSTFLFEYFFFLLTENDSFLVRALCNLPDFILFNSLRFISFVYSTFFFFWCSCMSFNFVLSSKTFSHLVAIAAVYYGFRCFLVSFLCCYVHVSLCSLAKCVLFFYFRLALFLCFFCISINWIWIFLLFISLACIILYERFSYFLHFSCYLFRAHNFIFNVVYCERDWW